MDKAPSYVEKIPFDPARIQPTSTTYIYCSQSDFRNMTRMAEHKIATDRQHWNYPELPPSHSLILAYQHLDMNPSAGAK